MKKIILYFIIMLMFVGASSWTINKFQSKKEFGLGVEFA
jgi:hypothetical protein